MSLRKPHPFADPSLQTSQSDYVIITQPPPFTIAVMAQVAFSVLRYSWTIGVGIGGEEANQEAKFFPQCLIFSNCCVILFITCNSLSFCTDYHWNTSKHWNNRTLVSPIQQQHNVPGYKKRWTTVSLWQQMCHPFDVNSVIRCRLPDIKSLIL